MTNFSNAPPLAIGWAGAISKTFNPSAQQPA